MNNKFLKEKLELEKKFAETETQLQKLRVQNNKLDMDAKKKQNEIEEFQNRLLQLEDALNDVERQKSFEINEAVRKENNEKERVVELLHIKEEEVKSLEKEISEMVQLHHKNSSELVAKELKILNEKLSHERIEYESKGQVLRQQVNELEDKVLLLSTELHRINFLYNQKVEEIHKITLENSELKLTIDQNLANQASRGADQQFIQKISQLEFKISEIQKEKDSFRTLYFDSKAQAEVLKSRMINTENISKQIDSHRFLRSSLPNEENQNFPQNENDQIIYLNKALKETRGQLMTRNSYYKELEAEYMILKGKYEQLYKEAEELQFSRDNYQAKSEINRSDLTKKHKELVRKIQEVDDLKRRYEEALGELDPVTTSTSRIVTRISVRKDSK